MRVQNQTLLRTLIEESDRSYSLILQALPKHSLILHGTNINFMPHSTKKFLQVSRLKVNICLRIERSAMPFIPYKSL